MSDDEYVRRVKEVESYYTDRVYDSNWRTRMYYGNAMDSMQYILECIEADLYGIERPDAPYSWTAKHIDYWTESWDEDNAGP